MTKKIKFKQETTKNGIWTDWIKPVMNGYHMKCCDCGLVHTMNFRAVKMIKKHEGIILPKKEYQIEFKTFRNNKLSKK